MHRSVRAALVSVSGVALAFGVAFPAAAGHETDPRSANLHPMGHTDDDRQVTSFFEPFFTDAAFWGKVAYQGVWFGGFRTIDISAPGNPKTLAEVDCGVFQGDVGVWENLVFRSVDFPVAGATAEDTCANDGEVVLSPTGGFEGIQIFDVQDPSTASADDLVTVVGTDCGSHTHTVVPDPDNDRVLIYVANSDSSPTYPETVFGNECAAQHGKFQIVEVPLADPAAASVIADVPLGPSAAEVVANNCHDIGVLVNEDQRLAACAGDVAVVFDITDPANPMYVSDFTAPDVTSWHSAAFSWDGSVTVMGWEPGGGEEPRCTADTPAFEKSIFFFDTLTGELLGTWTLPRPQSLVENCTIHNYSVVPTPKRDVLTAGSYQAGTWVVDFTDPAAAQTVAWSDPPPIDPENLALGGAWGSYWYNGFVYETNITEGLNIFRLSDSATAGARRLPFLNPQTQVGPIG